MTILSENPIKTTEIGTPCMLGEAVGRIVSLCDKGSWGVINGVDMYSIVFICTPHGSVIETGISHLSEISDKAMVRLLEYEEDALKVNGELYCGKLDEENKEK